MKQYLKKLTVLLACTAAFAITATASSHREAPLISNDPLADNTDVYAFKSPTNAERIVLIANYIPFEHPAGGPNWYTFGENIRYEIHVDNNTATAFDDVVYRFTFTSVNEDGTTFFNVRLGKQNIKTTYTCEKIVNNGTPTVIVMNGVVPVNNIGPRTVESGVGLGAASYDALMTEAIATATGNGGERIFCGPIDDPFFVDLGGAFDLGGFRKVGARDGLGKQNCHTIAIEVPVATLQKTGRTVALAANILDGDYVIGVYANASRPAVTTLVADGGKPTTSGAWIQVSRLGMPLTNEVVIPIGMKDKWNGTAPTGDGAFVPYFTNPELGLYMAEGTGYFGGAVPGLADLRIQTKALFGAGIPGVTGFDFRNGKDGLFPLKGSPLLDSTALADAAFGNILLQDKSPRSVDILPIFYTGVPNLPPYQLFTGKVATATRPVAVLNPGKPFINNFLPTLGDYLRLNMAVPATPRNSPDFNKLGIVWTAVLGLTDPRYTASGTALQMIPNMDGFPNGRRLEDDVTTIELQAVGGVALAAIGLSYDDDTTYKIATPQLIKTITFSEGVGKNDTTFKAAFPFVQTPWRGYTGAAYVGPKSNTFNLNLGAAPIAISAFPTPFKTSTSFHYKVSADAQNVTIEVVDALGRRIALINEGRKATGDYYVPFGKTNIAAGSYYVRMYVDGAKAATIGIVKSN